MADNVQVTKLTGEVKALNEEVAKLQRLLGGFGSSVNQVKSSFSSLETVWGQTRNIVGGISAGSAARSTGASLPQSVWAARQAMQPPASAAGGMGGSGGGGNSLSTGVGSPNGQGVPLSIGAISKATDILGAIGAGGLQYAYNRFEGNRGTSLGIAQALAPNAGMMGMKVEDMFRGLAQRTPVLGSVQDTVETVLAGQGVGAFMNANASEKSGVPGRKGFFESVRQMQLLTPGVGAGQLATTMANYIGNTKSQQMGQYVGQGAFTMIGKGGSYKSLAEWAEAILKFLSEQRPGKGQGTTFTKEELLSQNFPGSNINAWFQMMGVPQNMADYWWQYALANADKTSPVSAGLIGQTAQLQQNIQSTRGMDLGYERLRSVTQTSRRDYLMGTQMYGMYGARESADRRFNVAMQGADLTMGQMAKTTNAGAAMALLPTDIASMLMPLLTKLAASPVGVAGSAIGMIKNAITGDVPIGDPAGSYGSYGSTSTAHMSPDLAGKVGAMMNANPRIKVSSGYRDTVTQNRLYKNGVGRVGPASKSAHTRGWAADLGPTSELGWIQSNAKKFGLQTGSHAGEPWHVQLAGTMPIGDAIGNIRNIGASLGFGGPEAVIAGLSGGSGSLSGLVTSFIKSGDLSSLIDHAISMFIKLMTAPLAGLMSLGGKANFSNEDINSLINKPNSVKVDISKFSGFKTPDTASITGSDTLFGDPAYGMASQPATINARMDSPIIFKTEVHINGSSGNSPIDAQKTASTIADHLEAEFTRREWRKS